MNPWSVNWTDLQGNHHTDPLNINCHCFDPTITQVLNPAAWTPAAWTNVPNGQFAANESSIRSFRGICIPQESANFGRNFRIKERYDLSIRLEFTNIVNRLQLPQVIGLGNFASSPTKFAAGSSTASPGYGGQRAGRPVHVLIGSQSGAREIQPRALFTPDSNFAPRTPSGLARLLRYPLPCGRGSEPESPDVAGLGRKAGNIRGRTHRPNKTASHGRGNCGDVRGVRQYPVPDCREEGFSSGVNGNRDCVRFSQGALRPPVAPYFPPLPKTNSAQRGGAPCRRRFPPGEMASK
jgi:hypothetical protein